MQQDVHYQKGKTCQDCHASVDVQGDNFLAAANWAAANWAAVQIECADCHGTPQCYGYHVKIDDSRADECPENQKIDSEMMLEKIQVEKDSGASEESVREIVQAMLDEDLKQRTLSAQPKNEDFDWVAAGRMHQQPEHAADRGESSHDTIIPGKVTQQRSYLRWEAEITSSWRLT